MLSALSFVHWDRAGGRSPCLLSALIASPMMIKRWAAFQSLRNYTGENTVPLCAQWGVNTAVVTPLIFIWNLSASNMHCWLFLKADGLEVLFRSTANNYVWTLVIFPSWELSWHSFISSAERASNGSIDFWLFFCWTTPLFPHEVVTFLVWTHDVCVCVCGAA